MHSDIQAYHNQQSSSDRSICELLAKTIGSVLTQAESKVWHGHPVWFLNGNPIVGYSKQKAGWRLMFWSGASFGEVGLNVVGKKFKDASIFYTSIEEIKPKELKRWLNQSIAIQWDYKNIVKRKGRLEMVSHEKNEGTEEVKKAKTKGTQAKSPKTKVAKPKVASVNTAAVPSAKVPVAKAPPKKTAATKTTTKAMASKAVAKKTANTKTPSTNASASKAVAEKAKTGQAALNNEAQKAKKALTHDQRIASMTFSSVYPHYITKVEKKGRTKQELDQVIQWLTGYSSKKLQQLIQGKVTFESFFQSAKLHPNAKQITGVICGYRVEEIENPLTQQVRYLDKLVDELAKGRPMEKILRNS